MICQEQVPRRQKDRERGVAGFRLRPCGLPGLRYGGSQEFRPVLLAGLRIVDAIVRWPRSVQGRRWRRRDGLSGWWSGKTPRKGTRTRWRPVAPAVGSLPATFRQGSERAPGGIGFSGGRERVRGRAAPSSGGRDVRRASRRGDGRLERIGPGPMIASDRFRERAEVLPLPPGGRNASSATCRGCSWDTRSEGPVRWHGERLAPPLRNAPGG